MKLNTFNSIVERAVSLWSESREAILDKTIPENLLGKLTVEFLGFHYFSEKSTPSLTLTKQTVESLKESQSPASPSADLTRRRGLKESRDVLSSRLFALMQFTLRTLAKPSPSYQVNSSARLWTPFLPRIMPNLVDFLRALNSLQDPTAWEGLPSDFFATMSTLPPGAKKTLLLDCTVSFSERKDEQTELDYQLASIRGWANICRQQWYVVGST